MKDSITPAATDKCELCGTTYSDHEGENGFTKYGFGGPHFFTPKPDATPSKEAKHTPEKQMQLQDWREVSVPFGLLNETWAQRNHDQSLDRLNERGGLSVDEAIAIICCHEFVRRDNGKPLLKKLIVGYNIAKSAGAQEVEDLRKKLTALEFADNIMLKTYREERDQLRERNRVLEEALNAARKSLRLFAGTNAPPSVYAEIQAILSSNESTAKPKTESREVRDELS